MPRAPARPKALPAPTATLQKTAIICHSHPSISKGGAEISAYALYRGLLEIGVDAIFVCACAHADRARLAFTTPGEFAVYYDPQRYEHFYHLAPRSVEEQLLQLLHEQAVKVVNFHHFLNFGLNSLRAVRSLPGIRCWLTLHEFLAICHHHGQMVTRPSQNLCRKASTEACSDCYPEFPRSQFALRKDSLLDAFGAFDGYVSPSRFLAARYAEWGLPAARLRVIENGLLGSAPPELRSRNGTRWTFGYFGQINPFKGVDVLLDAAERLALDARMAESIRLRIHGNMVGQSDAFIQRFGKAQRDHPFLTYGGPYNSHAVGRLMSECDYVIIPSRWWENSPVVIQEAYAAARPVICSGIGGLAEKVIDGVSGLHFELGDAVDLARAMTLATDPGMAETLRGGIPAVNSAADMARAYVAALTAP